MEQVGITPSFAAVIVHERKSDCYVHMHLLQRLTEVMMQYM